MAKSRVKIGTGVLVVIAICAAGAIAFKGGFVPHGSAAYGPPAATDSDPSADLNLSGDSHPGDAHSDDPFAEPPGDQPNPDAAAPATPDSGANAASVQDEHHHHHHAHHEDGASDSDWQNADEGIHKVSGSKPADKDSSSGPAMPNDDSLFKDTPSSPSDSSQK
jgi:hypothetical protein